MVTVSQFQYNGKPACKIDVADDADALTVLATVVAIDYGIEGESLKTEEEKIKNKEQKRMCRIGTSSFWWFRDVF